MSAPPRCAYCHDAVGAAPLRCTRCGTLLHAACLVQLDRCPTLGCGVPTRACRATDRPLRLGARWALRALSLAGRL